MLVSGSGKHFLQTLDSEFTRVLQHLNTSFERFPELIVNNSLLTGCPFHTADDHPGAVTIHNVAFDIT